LKSKPLNELIIGLIIIKKFNGSRNFFANRRSFIYMYYQRFCYLVLYIEFFKPWVCWYAPGLFKSLLCRYQHVTYLNVYMSFPKGINNQLDFVWSVKLVLLLFNYKFWPCYWYSTGCLLGNKMHCQFQAK